MANTRSETWSKEAGYVWSMIGSAVGFANILSFSALCYKNGGGAFLIPYILAHALVGIPMLFLEGLVGQRSRLPLATAMGKAVGRVGKVFGWFAILTCATIGGFYIVLTGFSIAYTYFSAAGTLPATETAAFFKETFLHDSGSLSVLGGIAPAVLICTLFVTVITWFVQSRNIQSGIEKICSIFLPLLGILVVMFTGAACFLPGALEGIRHFLIPDFSRLNDWTLWRDVFGQVFFSLSLGLGIVTGYSRHNQDSFRLSRAMIKVACGDFIISFIAGIAIFGCMGFMSQKSGIPFSSLVNSDSAFEIGFVIFPLILSQFGSFLSHIIGPLFFFCVFIAGITGVFSIVESIAGNVEVEFRLSRKKAVSFALAGVTVLALPFCFGNGQHLLGTIAPMVLGNAMLIGGIAEIIVFLFLAKDFANDSLWFVAKRRSYSFYALKFIVLPLLVFSLVGALSKEFTTLGLDLAVCIRWGWFIVALLLASFFSWKKISQQNLYQIS